MSKKNRNKNHLPKRIAGVKLPKAIRRGTVGQSLASPVMANVIGNFVYDLTRTIAVDQASRPYIQRPLAVIGQAGRGVVTMAKDTVAGAVDAGRQYLVERFDIRAVETADSGSRRSKRGRSRRKESSASHATH